MIVLDTHIWVWFQTGDERLPQSISREIGRDSILSAASLWEVMLLLDKGRLSSALSPEETVRQWLLAAPMRVVPVDEEIVILSRTLEFRHDDPADRFIAATAFRCRAPLATLDAKLQGLSWLSALP